MIADDIEITFMTDTELDEIGRPAAEEALTLAPYVKRDDDGTQHTHLGTLDTVGDSIPDPKWQ